MKPQDKILTYEQARDLKWFCQNVTGVRQDMYKLNDAFEKMKQFDEKITRLEKTCVLIEEFLKQFNPPDVTASTANPEQSFANAVR